MSAAPRLRNDLQWLLPDEQSTTRAAHGSPRQQLLYDPISSTFTRLDRDHLQTLMDAPQRCDRQLLAAASAAGLLQSRSTAKPSRWQLGRLLSIRLPGFASAPVAARLARSSDILFSPLAVILWLMLIAVVGLAIPVYWHRFQSNLPGLQQFFSAGNMTLLLVTLIVSKLIHELAHATVCFRMGAKPGVIGLLLLCGAPCPYCDVTDSWRLESPARRAYIMLAGVYVELIMAAVAVLVWWYTSAGALHYLSMNVMVICGISTLLFNLNPLMRYDGYYVLADICGSTNLRQDAADAFSAVVVRPLAGKHYRVCASFSLRNALLALYHLASVLYRLVITIVIAGWLIHLCSRLSIKPAGVTLGSLLIIAMPLRGLQKWLALWRGLNPWHAVPWARRGAIASSVALVTLFILFVPLPHTYRASGTVDVADAVAVYLPDDGRVQAVMADYGDHVVTGQPLVQLENMGLRLQATEMEGNRQALQTRTDQLRRRAIEQTELLSQWDSQLATLQTIAQREHKLADRLAGLLVHAPAGGMVLPPLQDHDEPTTNAPGVDSQARQRLPFADPSADGRWQRSLYWGQGSWARSDALWCRIGDPSRLAVVLEIDASERAHVRIGDSMRVRCDPFCGSVANLDIDSISTVNASTHQPQGSLTRFRVAARVPTETARLWPIGAPVMARLRGPSESLAQRAKDWIKEFFRDG